MIQPDIKLRTLFLAIVPAMLIALLLTAYSTVNSLQALDRGLHDRGRTIAIQLAAASEYGAISGNTLILQHLIQKTMTHENDVQAVVVTDSAGYTLAVSGKPVMLDKIAQSSRAAAPREWESQSHLLFSAPIIRSVVEVDDYAVLSAPEEVAAGLEQRIVGQVYVVVSTNLLAQLKQTLVGNNLLLALLGLSVSGVVGWLIGRSITRPIKAMARAVSKLAEGELDVRVPESASGELRLLQRGLNHMASRLQQAHEDMQERIDNATLQLRYQAHHDPLTGLYNRREFEQRLQRALKNAQHLGQHHVCCYMDLDQFKIVNDTCGHSAGDELLRHISVLLAGRVREQDTLARLGGDEFGLLLENCSLKDAHFIADTLRETVCGFRYVYENKIFSVGVSIGMIAVTGDTSNVEEIMSGADSACFAAKDAGRNQVHVYEASNPNLMQRHGEMQWITRLTSALEDNCFRLYVQPIRLLAAEQSQPAHYEILLRKVDQDGRIILPMAFIPAAERFQFMGAIDRWVIRQTFAMFSDILRDKHLPQPCMFSINLSGVSLGDKTLLNYIREQFIIHQVPPHCIGFEITETSAITNLSNTLELMKSLKAMGCHFLLDDFGSGMSSFGYLKSLPVDFIKIDGSFIRELQANPLDRAVVQSIHSIAQAMNIKTIAEFVENAAMVEILQAIGVHYGQGFHLGRPRPIEQLDCEPAVDLDSSAPA